MVERKKITDYISELFQDVNFPDFSYNGLQFEGKNEVKKIVSGVDATVEFFKEAIKRKADFAVVHHGIFWKGAEWRKLDRFAQEIVQVLGHGALNLYAMHLPLDAHPEIGNNVLLAKALKAKVIAPFGSSRGNKIGVLASFSKPITVNALKKHIEKEIGSIITHLDFGKKSIKTIGIVSGGGWNSVMEPIVYDGEVDAILTGEVIHQAVPPCRDRKIHMISAGHYATEQFGVQAWGKNIADKFKLKHEFIDLPTGL